MPLGAARSAGRSTSRWRTRVGRAVAGRACSTSRAARSRTSRRSAREHRRRTPQSTWSRSQNQNQCRCRLSPTTFHPTSPSGRSRTTPTFHLRDSGGACFASPFPSESRSTSSSRRRSTAGVAPVRRHRALVVDVWLLRVRDARDLGLVLRRKLLRRLLARNTRILRQVGIRPLAVSARRRPPHSRR